MPSITVGPLSNYSTLQFSSAENGQYAQILAAQIASSINLGANYPTPVYQQTVYPQGAKTVNGVPYSGAPASGQGGIAAFRGTTNPQTVFVDPANQFVVVDASSGPVSLQGGAVGQQVISGSTGAGGSSAGLTFTQITPFSTAAIDFFAALGGNNLFQTSGAGNYIFETGDGNDTINTLGAAQATIDAGTGRNAINVGGGTNLIGSEGYDTITGVGYGTAGAVDTINIGSGQTSINSGGNSFLINDNSPNPLLVTLGSGVDTINYGVGSNGATVTGLTSGLTVTGGLGTIAAGDATTTVGGSLATLGDSYTVTGSLSTNITLRGGADTIIGSGDLGNSTYTAGSGSSFISAGAGNDTLVGAKGVNAQATLVSGSGPTTFEFIYNSSQVGGNDVIAGFKASDTLQFVGYGANPLGIGAVNGNTFSLTDGTTITFTGGGVPNSPNTTGIGVIKTS